MFYTYSGEVIINFLVEDENQEEQKMEKNVNLLEKLMMKIRKGNYLLFMIPVQFVATYYCGIFKIIVFAIQQILNLKFQFTINKKNSKW